MIQNYYTGHKNINKFYTYIYSLVSDSFNYPNNIRHLKIKNKYKIYIDLIDIRILKVLLPYAIICEENNSLEILVHPDNTVSIYT